MDKTAIALALATCLSLLTLGCSDRAVPSANAAKPAAPQAPDIAWPMTRGGPELSGGVRAPLPMNPSVAWTFASSGPITAEAAIAGGRVFVGTSKGTLHCLSASSGKEFWKFETKDAITAAPAIKGSRVFVTSNDGHLYALNVDTGAELWKFTGEDKMSSGAIPIKAPEADEDWVLVNGYDGSTRVLRAADGSVVWTYATEDFINGSPAVVDGRYLVFGGCDSQLHVVNLKDGALVRKIPTDAQIPASIGTFGAMAFCGNYANQVVAFDVTGGKVAWVYEDRPLPFFSSPAIDQRLVLIGSRDKHLHAIHRESGEEAWKFRTGGRIEGSPILFENGVLFGSADGRLYAANLDAGAEIWQLDLGEPLIGSPSFGGQQIIIGGEKGTVFAVKGQPPST